MNAETTLRQPERRTAPVTPPVSAYDRRKNPIDPLLVVIPHAGNDVPHKLIRKESSRNSIGWAIAAGLVMGGSALYWQKAKSTDSAPIQLARHISPPDRAQYRWVGFHRMAPIDFIFPVG